MSTRGLPKPSPPPCQESAELTYGKRADAGRRRKIQTRNWDAENGKKGENNTKRRHLLTVQFFCSQIQNEDSPDPSFPYWVDKMCLSASGALWRPFVS